MPRKVLRSPRLVRREKEKRKRKAILISILLAVLAGGLTYGFLRPEFRITTLEVSGFSRLSEERIRASVEQGLQGVYFGIVPKAHTLLYPQDALRERLLREFPELSGVSFSLRNLSSLRVAVHEREPIAYWCSDTFGCFLMDEVGFVFAEAPLGTEQMYFHIEKVATSSPLGTYAIERERLAKLISFFRQLELLELDPERIRLVGDDELDVMLKAEARILLRESDFDGSIRRLETLLKIADVLPAGPSRLGVTYLDLRYGNKIYFK